MKTSIWKQYRGCRRQPLKMTVNWTKVSDVQTFSWLFGSWTTGHRQQPLIHSLLKYRCGRALYRASFETPTNKSVHYWNASGDGLCTMHGYVNERQCYELHMVGEKGKMAVKWTRLNDLHTFSQSLAAEPLVTTNSHWSISYHTFT